MKKFYLLGALLLACLLPLRAASEAEMLQAISRSGAEKSEVLMSVQETRAMPHKEKATLHCSLRYCSPDYLEMAYDQADKEYFLIDGKKMVRRRGGREEKFDLSKNQLMRRLANTLLYAFSGQVEKISTEQNTTLTVIEEKSSYYVVLDARKKQVMGYSHIEIHYRKSDGQIVLMQMDEFNGASTIYALAE